MHPAAIFCEMIRGMPTLSIGREAIPAGGRGVAARCAEGAPLVRRPLVAAIGPQPRRRGLAGAPSRRLQAIACPLPDRAFPMPEKGATGCQHLHGGVVRCPAVHVYMHERGRRSPVPPAHGVPLSADCCAIACRATDGIGQRLQQGRGFANPVRQRRAVQVQPVALEDLALAIERQVIGVFIDPLPPSRALGMPCQAMGRRCLHRREGGHGPAGRGRGDRARWGVMVAEPA
jgi:hypothetical protein